LRRRLIERGLSLHQAGDFWHYAKIARYDLAIEFGNKILSWGAR
jgi:hypothetical protein